MRRLTIKPTDHTLNISVYPLYKTWMQLLFVPLTTRIIFSELKRPWSCCFWAGINLWYVISQSFILTSHHSHSGVNLKSTYCFALSTNKQIHRFPPKRLTCDFFLIIVIVTGGEQLSEDKSWHKNLLHLVLHHRNTLPVIPHTDGVVLTAQRNTHLHEMTWYATEKSGEAVGNERCELKMRAESFGYLTLRTHQCSLWCRTCSYPSACCQLHSLQEEYQNYTGC